MHPLHDDIARLLAEKIRTRGVVVWYDPRSEFVPFTRELRGASADDQVSHVIVAGGPAQFYEHRRSMFELRAMIEPSLSHDAPEPLVVYLPGRQRDEGGSVLMEAELAGCVWEPVLKRLARNVLRRKLTDGDIDVLLAPDAVKYDDIAAAASDDGGSGPSLLKGIFREAVGGDAILAAWLVDDGRDAEISEKGSEQELLRLARSRLGIELADTTLPKARSVTLRYVLGGEFRSDLTGSPPSALDSVTAPRTKADELAVREMASRLRTSYEGLYADIADRVEAELGLAMAGVAAADLGSIDTFRFEEHVVFEHCADVIADGRFDEARAVIAARDGSFWLNLDLSRRSQWDACGRMAELGRVATEVLAEVRSASGNAADWVERYSEPGGWMRADQVQRRMESFISKLDEDPPERAIAVVRRAYDELCQVMADGFTKVVVKAEWSVPTVMHQTQVYERVVAAQPRPVAYFLVDAMRYEMGAELVDRLPTSAEVRIRPAVASLPSITPVGMAALHPGAEASFDVVAQGGKLGSRIDGTFLPDLSARRKFAASRIPALADLTLGDVLDWSKTRLAAHIAGAEVVFVRSQEIDDAGEGGFAHHAREVMDSVIGNLARAIRKLRDAGIEQAVLSADHGYLFAYGDRDESMRLESPGGEKIQLHRRCWIGRGGANPVGGIRVSAADLGYDSDLELVFPRGVGVFKAGGDLAYHHGGTSLQEMVVPVITVRSAPVAPVEPSKDKLTVTNLPYEITNRIFSVVLELGGKNLAMFASPTIVKPMLLASGVQAGGVIAAPGADFDADTGTVAILPATPVTVGLFLSNDTVDSVRIVVCDPVTDAELYRAPADIPVRLGVA